MRNAKHQPRAHVRRRGAATPLHATPLLVLLVVLLGCWAAGLLVVLLLTAPSIADGCREGGLERRRVRGVAAATSHSLAKSEQADARRAEEGSLSGAGVRNLAR